MKENNFQHRILFPPKITFKSKGKIKSFPIMLKLRECIIKVDLKMKHTRNSSGRRELPTEGTLKCRKERGVTDSKYLGKST